MARFVIAVRLASNNRLIRWITGLLVLGVCVAPFAGELHLLLHDHGSHPGIQPTHAASHAGDPSPADGAPENSRYHSLDSDALSGADFGLAADCYLCNLPSHRLAANLTRARRLVLPVAETTRVFETRAEYSRAPVSRNSRGPPLNA
ncbi:MAG: hypothetical protein RIF32_20010 [Leptospirales bacterium]|jgi:hypothetical protein